MFIILNGETFESTLVHMPRAGCVKMCVVPRRVRHGNPVQESAHCTVFLWDKNHVPMVGHPTITQHVDRMIRKPFNKDSFERFVIFGFVKNRLTLVAAIQSVINLSSNVRAEWAWHSNILEQVMTPTYPDQLARSTKTAPAPLYET